MHPHLRLASYRSILSPFFKTMNNKVPSLISRLTALALFSSPFCVTQTHGQEVYSQIVGAIALDVPSQSDVVVAFPFKRSASIRGQVSSVEASAVAISDVALTANEFAATGGEPTHYLYVESGALEGRRYDIVSNTATTITVDGAEIGALDDAQVSVREHWTLGKAFPSGLGEPEVEPGLRQFELIVPTQVSLGTGIAAERVFYFYNSAWREVGKPLTKSASNVAFEPGTAFVVRNNAMDTLRTYLFGEVVQSTLAIPVVSSAAEAVDNFVAFERPLAVSLDELDGVTEVIEAGDRLVVFGRTNKFGPGKSVVEYEYTGVQWQQVGTTANAGGHMIEPGEGIAIRKAAGADAENFWVNEWSLPTND